MNERKCLACRKQRRWHRVGDLACPIGKAMRNSRGTLGYADYASGSAFKDEKGTCQAPGCDRPLGTRTKFCEAHYYRLRRVGRLGKGEINAINYHGLSDTPEYAAWTEMRNRCNNPRHKRAKYYSARGIKVCARWNSSFDAFYEDMGKRPSPQHSLDRIDNNKGYEPGNCRWATWTEQSRNRSITRLVEAFGKKKPITQWAEEFGTNRNAIRARLKYGWTPEDAVSTPIDKSKRRNA